MNKNVLPALMMFVFSLACGGRTEPAGGVTPPPAVQEIEGLPDFPYEGVPGWLGFASRPRDARVNPWTAEHPNAQVVIFNPSGWEELAEGTPFTGASSQGPLRLKYSEFSEIPFGCDDVPTSMVAFQGPYDLEEEAIWLVPGENQAVRSLPLTQGPASKTQNEWTVGGHTVKVEASGERKGVLTILSGGKEIYRQPFEQTLMEGAEPDGVLFDLSDKDTIGLPLPIAVFQGDGWSAPLLVLVIRGFEGVNFELLRLGDSRVDSLGKQYVYICAF